MVSQFPDSIRDEIVRRISTGETLSSICRDAHMPERTTVYLWREQDESFNQRFARAREIGYDALAEQVLEIADTPVMGVITEQVLDKDGKQVGMATVKREDALGHRKLQTWARTQLLAKWDPKRYGDRQQVEHSGSIGLESLVTGEGVKKP
jgi:hypothetical protein